LERLLTSARLAGDTLIYISIRHVALFISFRMAVLIPWVRLPKKLIDRELRPFCTLC